MTALSLRADVTVGRLRGWAPEWTWTAERYGFGWCYHGQKLSEGVCVYAEAVLVGEDDFDARWMADDGVRHSLSSWLMVALGGASRMASMTARGVSRP